MVSYPIDFEFENLRYEAMVARIETDGLEVFHIYNMQPKLSGVEEPFTFVLKCSNKEINWCSKNNVQARFGLTVSRLLVSLYRNTAKTMAS